MQGALWNSSIRNLESRDYGVILIRNSTGTRVKLKIAWLAPYDHTLLLPELDLARKGGSHPSSWIVNLASTLGQREGLELHLVTVLPFARNDQTFRREGVHFHIIRHSVPFTHRGYPPWLPVDTFLGYRSLRRKIHGVIDSIDPDIVHGYGTEYVYGLAAVESGRPALVSIQGLIGKVMQEEFRLFYRFQAPLEQDTISRCENFDSRTEWVNEFLRSMNPQARIFTIHRAVRDYFFDIERQRGASLLYVGSIEERKGVTDLLRAMQIVQKVHPAVRLQLVGSGSAAYIHELEEYVRQHRLSSIVQFCGGRSAREVAAYHAQASILVHPSHVDNSPNSIAEAMCSGLTVVSTQVGGIPSMIEHERTGLLVPAGQPQQLADAISRLLTHPEEATQLALCAREVARKRYNSQRVADSVLEVYKRVLNTPNTNS
jgi:glycosyltransferase involved in cell wall biosynthesis